MCAVYIFTIENLLFYTPLREKRIDYFIYIRDTSQEFLGDLTAKMLHSQKKDEIKQERNVIKSI